MKGRIIGKVEQQVSVTIRSAGVRKVVLGLSGGADSVALLRVLLHLGVETHPVHCNFHLRGEESDRDMEFCRNLCQSHEMPLEIVHFDVPGYEAEHGVGTEEACRELRYSYFREMMLRLPADRIAVAHHADDNIETLFINLFRGAGISGLRGMLPDSNGVIRPLLTTTRNEILEYLAALGQDYMVDSTNLNSDYRRNFIRNELLPAIETRWTGVRKAITNTIGNLQSDERALDAVAEKLLDLNDPDFLSYDIIRNSPDPQWLLHRWLSRFGCKANVAREIAAMMHRDVAGHAPRPDSGKSWKALSGRVIATSRGLQYDPTLK